jgi:hypothetical protein
MREIRVSPPHRWLRKAAQEMRFTRRTGGFVRIVPPNRRLRELLKEYVLPAEQVVLLEEFRDESSVTGFSIDAGSA